MLFSEARELLGIEADTLCIPTGKIETEEQYNYLKYYAEHTSIDTSCIKSFEESVDKYIKLNYWFNGGRFYFTLSDEPQGNMDCAVEDKFGRIVDFYKFDEEFSYGKLGKIEF